MSKERPGRSTHVALGLRLVAVALHDVLEIQWLLRHLGHDVHGAHQQLVQVAVAHQVRALCQCVFKAGPHLATQIFVMHLQLVAQLSQPHSRQVVDLVENNRGVTCKVTELSQLHPQQVLIVKSNCKSCVTCKITELSQLYSQQVLIVKSNCERCITC